MKFSIQSQINFCRNYRSKLRSLFVVLNGVKFKTVYLKKVFWKCAERSTRC